MEILFQAADLSIKFLSRDQAVEVVRVVAPRMAGRRKHGDVSGCAHTHARTHTCTHVSGPAPEPALSLFSPVSGC